jgi:ribonuclease HII
MRQHDRRAHPRQGRLFDPPDRVLAHLPRNAVAGIDEAGRGCLAGPVVAAAVILPESFTLPGLADSKTLSPARRAGLAEAVTRIAVAWSLGVVWPRDIDRLNILQATLTAMSRAAATLGTRPEGLLIDGNSRIPEDMLAAAGCIPLPVQRAIVNGDAVVPIISAASIIAKTFRDTLMTRLDLRYPGYGFAAHKGYGTPEHYNALRELGPCRMHRLTFRGVRPADVDASVSNVRDRLC